MITIHDGVKQDSSGLYIDKYSAETSTVYFLLSEWLQDGAAISTVSQNFTVVSVSVSKNAAPIVIEGSTYAPNTVVIVNVSGGTAATTHTGAITVTTNEAPASIKTIPLRVKVK